MSKKRLVTEKVTNFDYIFDIKDFIVCFVCNEIVNQKSFENSSNKFVNLQTKKIFQSFLIQKSLIITKMHEINLSTQTKIKVLL